MVQAWMKLIWNSLGVAVVAAAAQLAIAQSLGIVRWSDTYPAGNATGWNALLTWIGFIYAVSVLGGAAVGRRAVRRPTRPDTMAARIAAALSAGVGASIAVAIAWLPAQHAHPPVNVHPELVVALTAAAGIVAGIVVALGALSIPPVAGAVRAAVAWIWIVAVGSAIAGNLTHKSFAAPRLAVLDAPSIVPVAWWSGPYAMIWLAAILGASVAAVARWGGAHRWGIAVSGPAGPAVVAAAYLIAGPGAGADRGAQLDPYRASLIAILVGLVASIAVVLPNRTKQPRTVRDESYAASARNSAPAPRPAWRHPEEPYLTDSEPVPGPQPYPQPQAQPQPHGQETYQETYQATAYDVPQHDGSATTYDLEAYPAASAPVAAAAAPNPYHALAAVSADPHPTAERPVVTPRSAVAAPTMGQPPAGQPTMGQPPKTYEEDYSDWLKDLGHVKK